MSFYKEADGTIELIFLYEIMPLPMEFQAISIEYWLVQGKVSIL